MIEQQFVEVRARHLVGAIGLGSKPVFEIKLHAVAAARAVHLAPEFFHEPGASELLVQPEARERLHAKREQRFANVESRELVALEHHDAPTGPGEQRGRGAPGRSAADNCYVKVLAAHWATKVANFGAMPKTTARVADEVRLVKFRTPSAASGP